MFLNTLSTPAEKTAFANLAFTVAKADGGIEYEELPLLKNYLTEMGLNYHDYPFRTAAPQEACRCFTSNDARHVVFVNLLALNAAVAQTHHPRQQALLHSIAESLLINDRDERSCFDWISHLNGADQTYYPD